MKIIKTEQGNCPICQSEDIEWCDEEIVHGHYCYVGMCMECNSTVTEWHALTYIETTGETND